MEFNYVITLPTLGLTGNSHFTVLSRLTLLTTPPTNMPLDYNFDSLPWSHPFGAHRLPDVVWISISSGRKKLSCYSCSLDLSLPK